MEIFPTKVSETLLPLYELQICGICLENSLLPSNPDPSSIIGTVYPPHVIQLELKGWLETPAPGLPEFFTMHNEILSDNGDDGNEQDDESDDDEEIEEDDIEEDDDRNGDDKEEEDEFDEDDEDNDDLDDGGISEEPASEGDGSDEEDDLEDGEELGGETESPDIDGDGDDDEDDDEDLDEEEYGSDWEEDDDEDKFDDEDDEFKALYSAPPQDAPPLSPPSARDATTASQSRTVSRQAGVASGHNEFDVT